MKVRSHLIVANFLRKPMLTPRVKDRIERSISS
jgi:hypothetical protein